MMTMLGITGQKVIGLILMEMIELKAVHFLLLPHQCGPREVLMTWKETMIAKLIAMKKKMVFTMMNLASGKKLIVQHVQM